MISTPTKQICKFFLTVQVHWDTVDRFCDIDCSWVKCFSWQGEHHYLIPLSIHTHLYNHHHPVYAWNHPFLTIWHALSLLMSSQIAALCLLFKLCPPFHTPLSLSTYLSVVSSDYTCLVPCCSLLSTILSCFAVNTVFRSIAHRFYWWDRSTFYWAEMHKVHIKVYCAHITTSEWKGHVASTTQGDESRKRWRLSSQHDDCGLMTCWLWLWEQGPWSQKIFNTVCGFLQWWQRNKEEADFQLAFSREVIWCL